MVGGAAAHPVGRQNISAPSTFRAERQRLQKSDSHRLVFATQKCFVGPRPNGKTPDQIGGWGRGWSSWHVAEALGRNRVNRSVQRHGAEGAEQARGGSHAPFALASWMLLLLLLLRQPNSPTSCDVVDPDVEQDAKQTGSQRGALWRRRAATATDENVGGDAAALAGCAITSIINSD